MGIGPLILVVDSIEVIRLDAILIAMQNDLRVHRYPNRLNPGGVRKRLHNYQEIPATPHAVRLVAG
jgi:hypothetical protein